MSPILTLAHLYELTGDRTYLPYLDVWSEWVMHEMPRTEEGGLQHIVFNRENPQQLWDDTLMMCVLPLAKVGRLLGRQDYLAEAQRQFLLHVKYLHDAKTGLWFHGWTFAGRHHFAQALWARGNCWVTIAIPEFIELMGLTAGDPVRTCLIDTLHTQVSMLAKCQDSSGLWHTLITDPTSYLESSATAGFAYGIMKAVRKRYLPREYEPVAIKALHAVIDNIDANGELLNVSFGTAMGSDLEYYRNVPLTSMPYGSRSPFCVSRSSFTGTSEAHRANHRQLEKRSHPTDHSLDQLSRLWRQRLPGRGCDGGVEWWILYFYTTFCALSAVQATSIFAVARVIDALASPTIGHLSDNFSATRLGRRFGRRRFSCCSPFHW